MASFYEIQSKGSQVAQKGLFKRVLACGEIPGVFLFCWLDAQGHLAHYQLLYDEQVIDWKAGQGFVHAWTNRRSDGVGQQIGLAKGSRSLELAEDPEGRAQGMSLLGQASFPAPFDQLIGATLN
ncbi:MAG: hypothetical protein RRB13_15950 [bacterium]|nr:hypothetical protein [bacterium]